MQRYSAIVVFTRQDGLGLISNHTNMCITWLFTTGYASDGFKQGSDWIFCSQRLNCCKQCEEGKGLHLVVCLTDSKGKQRSAFVTGGWVVTDKTKSGCKCRWMYGSDQISLFLPIVLWRPDINVAEVTCYTTTRHQYWCSLWSNGKYCTFKDRASGELTQVE